MPGRVVLQDFTGVPAVVDLAAMRSAVGRLGGDVTRINPLVPADLVIDHSVQVDQFGTLRSFFFNVEMEYKRNSERYALLRWAQESFQNFRVVPPGTGIVHQVNLEYLARSSQPQTQGSEMVAFPDTLVGTDSHTTMINGLGVLGWGVGGIEAEAVLLGQPLYQLMPEVVGFRLTGELQPGRDGHRPGALCHPDPAQARRGRPFCRIFRQGPEQSFASRPRDHRQHGAGVRRDRRPLPGRRRNAALPACDGASGSADRSGRALLEGAGALPHRRDARPESSTTSWSSISATSSRAWPVHAVRRTGLRWAI